MKNLHQPTVRKKYPRTGFSLVELLIVIAVIGILASLILPSVLGDDEEAQLIKAKRNAQTVATLAQMARAVGDTEVSNSQNVEQAIQHLMTGVRGNGIMVNNVMKLSELNAEEIQEAKAHLHFANGMLMMK
jgi:prepilin-type N-terminal cleavage/methylation domain-containing protein